jgi:predicted RNA-binding Zn-ribbon protein involved in translation (DUF1610 family)
LQKSLPDHAPIIAADFVCDTCGKTMTKTIRKSRRGVEGIVYECYNKDTGCSYQVETKVYCTSSPQASRPKEVVA